MDLKCCRPLPFRFVVISDPTHGHVRSDSVAYLNLGNHDNSGRDTQVDEPKDSPKEKT